MTTPRELQTLYEQGKNITQILRDEHGTTHNTDEIIEIAYDLQSGSYIAALDRPEIKQHKADYTAEIAKTILSLCKPSSVLEAGVGEATTLGGVMRNLGDGIDFYGFDLSWSRVAYAKRWLEGQGITKASLCTGNLFNIPFADNSIDVVYTSHSMEPNGGNEVPILQELYRITRQFLILLEPGYELADADARRRMDHHGYCKGLKAKSQDLGYDVRRHELFPLSANPLNPTAITVIAKPDSNLAQTHVLACPRFKSPLEPIGGMLFSPEALVAYPIVGNIPCLRIENGIFASKYKELGAAGQK